MKFISAVSKGSRFNQIYVPRNMDGKFESGDLVEVRLLQKRIRLCYSKGLQKLSTFKENLIREVFSFLSRFEGLQQIFVVGSFLTEKVDYNDIDILLVTDKQERYYEERIYPKLVDKFNLRFHIISIAEDRLSHLLEVCPLTRSMLYYHVSDKKSLDESNRKIDESHLRFLLMMPEDVLEIDVSSRVFYDSMRRLLTIERFLEVKDEDPVKINDELKKTLGDVLFFQLKSNEAIDEKIVKRIRALIMAELDKIKGMIEHGQNRNAS